MAKKKNLVKDFETYETQDVEEVPKFVQEARDTLRGYLGGLIDVDGIFENGEWILVVYTNKDNKPTRWKSVPVRYE